MTENHKKAVFANLQISLNPRKPDLLSNFNSSGERSPFTQLNISNADSKQENFKVIT